MSAIIVLLFIAACIWNCRHVIRTYHIQQLPRNRDWDSESVLSSDIRRALHNPTCVHEWSSARRGVHECLKGCGAAMHVTERETGGDAK